MWTESGMAKKGVVAGVGKLVPAPTGAGTRLTTAFANRGHLYASWQQWDRAIADYDKAILLLPHDKDLFFERARLWVKKVSSLRT